MENSCTFQCTSLPVKKVCVKFFLKVRWPSFAFFFFFFIQKIHSYVVLTFAEAQWAEPPMGAEPRFELGLALQPASALSTEPHCIHAVSDLYIFHNFGCGSMRNVPQIYLASTTNLLLGGNIFSFFSNFFNTALSAAPKILLNARIELRTVATLALAVRRCITTRIYLNKSSEAIQYF